MLAVIGMSIVAGFALYVGLLHSPLLRSNPILFYRGLLLGGADAVVLALLLALSLPRLKLWDPAILIAAVMASLSVNLTFLIVIPVTIDRSVSVFLLSRIEAAPPQAPLDAQGLRATFVRDYVIGMAQIDRRIDEQTRSGNLVVDHGRLRLTPQGERFMRLSRTLARLFGTDPRFVGGDRGMTVQQVKGSEPPSAARKAQRHQIKEGSPGAARLERVKGIEPSS